MTKPKCACPRLSVRDTERGGSKAFTVHTIECLRKTRGEVSVDGFYGRAR